MPKHESLYLRGKEVEIYQSRYCMKPFREMMWDVSTPLAANSFLSFTNSLAQGIQAIKTALGVSIYSVTHS